MNTYLKTATILLSLVLIIGGCSVKKENVEDDVGNKIKDETNDQGPFLTSEIQNIEIKNDSVALHVNLEVGPTNVNHKLYAFQNGIPVEFSLEESQKPSFVQTIKPANEKNQITLYMKTKDFKKGEKINLGFGIVINADYLPEVSNFIMFNDSMIQAYGKDFIADQDYQNQNIDTKVMNNLKWTSTGKKDEKNLMPSYLLDTDKKVFDDMFSGKSYNSGKVIQTKKGKTLHISLTKNGLAPNGTISFYLNHQPLKLVGGYDAAILTYPNDYYGIADFDLIIPDDIEKGNYAFYAIIAQTEEAQGSGGVYAFKISDERLVQIE